MPVTISTTEATRFKACFAPSLNIGLCLRSNGEQLVTVIDKFGFMVPASIPVPTVAPVVADGEGPGQMVVGQFNCYVYCYAAARRYPDVEGDSVGGFLYPRGNPSPPSLAYVTPNSGSNQLTLTYPDNTVRTDIDRIWIFRTIDQPVTGLATKEGAAGDLYFLDEIPIPPGTAGGTVTYTDIFATPTDDIAEYDNYGAPQFQFCVYADPYWWGFGNYPLKVAASWDSTGLVTFTGTTPFNFDLGRYNQECYLQLPDGADTTNIQRQYYAAPVTGNPLQCQLQSNVNDTAPGAPLAGEGFIVFAGPSTTLYRSKYRNPFSWGTTSYVGDIRVPYQYAFQVGGGTGSGIAQIPSIPLLVLSTKNPSATYTLDLRLAGTDQFNGTLKVISNLYSVTSHFSQFSGSVGIGTFSIFSVNTRRSQLALFGYDADNFCLTVCDGNLITPISGEIQETLRNLSTDPALQQLAHGVYDSNSLTNCMWLASNGATDAPDVLVMQHSVTGTWHIQFEGDVLSSAILQSSFASLNQLFVGTYTGFFGTGMDFTILSNWITGFVLYGEFVTSQLSLSTAIPSITPGLVGSWMLVVDSNGGNDQWGRISAISGDGLTPTVDKVYSPTLGWGVGWFRVPVTDDKYYIGLIEVAMSHYFDMGAFMDDRKLDELWVAMENVDPNNPTFIQYFRDRLKTPLLLPTNGFNLPLTQVEYDDGTPSQQWFTDNPPAERLKVFGLRIVDRGYTAWKFYGLGGKLLAPAR